MGFLVTHHVVHDAALSDLAGVLLPLDLSNQLSKLLSLLRRLPVVPPLPPLNFPNIQPIRLMTLNFLGFKSPLTLS